MSTKELLINLQNSNDKVAYQALLAIEAASAETNEFYSYLDDFEALLASDKNYVKIRGFRLLCKQAQWDTENKLDSKMSHMLTIFDSEKPIVVRQCLEALHDLLLYKTNLSEQVELKLKSIDITKFNDAMRPLIEKDIANILNNL